MTGEEVYKLLQEIADTDDYTLQEKFGTYDLQDIILGYSLEELCNTWKEI